MVRHYDSQKFTTCRWRSQWETTLAKTETKTKGMTGWKQGNRDSRQLAVTTTEPHKFPLIKSPDSVGLDRMSAKGYACWHH